MGEKGVQETYKNDQKGQELYPAADGDSDHKVVQMESVWPEEETIFMVKTRWTTVKIKNDSEMKLRINARL